MSFSIFIASIFFSCKKANDEWNEANKPPVTIAGPDQLITLQTNSTSLVVWPGMIGVGDYVYFAGGQVSDINGYQINKIWKLKLQ